MKYYQLGTWGLPLLGLAGTVVAMAVAFARIGTEPQWQTVVAAAGTSLVVVGFGLIVFLKAAIVEKEHH